MKRSILVLVLTLGSLSLALPSIYSGSGLQVNSHSNQSDNRSAQSSMPVNEKEKPVIDIYGKRFRADESYVAQRNLRNGQVIAYRKNEREIAALVKALKEDGVTDKELLNPQTWLKILCQQVPDGKCTTGGCDDTYCKASPWKNTYNTERIKSNLEAMIYCRCAPLPG